MVAAASHQRLKLSFWETENPLYKAGFLFYWTVLFLIKKPRTLVRNCSFL